MGSEAELIELRNKMREKLAVVAKLKKETKEDESNMPLRYRIQKSKEVWNRVYENQKDTFYNYSAKKWNIPKEDVADLFAEYFTEFENEKTNSIAQFLYSRGYRFTDDKQGKIIIG